MDKTNKQLLAELTEYLLTQDPKVVAKQLANCMLDIYRMVHVDKLPDEEVLSLQIRTNHNVAELVKFAKFGPSGPLILDTLNSD